MPLVYASVSRLFAETSLPVSQVSPILLLEEACKDIVSSELNTKQGPLTRDDIEFTPILVHTGLTADVILHIVAYPYVDRRRKINGNKVKILERLTELFEGYTFGVGISLSLASWTSNIGSPAQDTLSMARAVDSYEMRRIGKILTTPSPTLQTPR